MRFTDEHLNKFLEQGFVIIEKFFTEEERLNALDGFNSLYAPSFDDYVAAGRVNNTPKQRVFPWDHAGLNLIGTHPELIHAIERVIGTREIRLCSCALNLIYAGDTRPDDFPFHVDHGGNTLGPYQPNDRTNITVIVAFEDVTAEMGPTFMVPTGKDDDEAVSMIVPGGSICIYSAISTRHAASAMTSMTGYRANLWAIYSRKDELWNGATWFTYKTGYIVSGEKSGPSMIRFISEASPRQLELIGFPPVDDPLWTDEFLDGMVDRYPDFDPAPYRAARNGG